MKILIIFGTRPEAIKMAPLVKQFKRETAAFNVKVCVTAQHRQMLDQALDFFEITPDYDLNLMREGQNLFGLTADIVTGLKPVLEDARPDYVFVHGDTTTSTVAALAAFYAGARTAHVEAGLRTRNKLSPFPEEINRQLTARIADLHFAPTEAARQNLLTENVQGEIHVTGNTVIDALMFAVDKLKNYSDDEIRCLQQTIDPVRRKILVTGHRRENFGEGFVNICNALLDIARSNDVEIIYPVHLNPNVRRPVMDILGNEPNIRLIEPLSYPAFVWLMEKSHIILTDSGGVQEEAPSLGKPVLVMRNTTERPEAVEAGTVILTGADRQRIVSETGRLLTDSAIYEAMQQIHNPYGDGLAAQRIVDIMKKEINYQI
jgi:UDP-N-acetylglucosamine 2-epimerase (non-hydrolysing)